MRNDDKELVLGATSDRNGNAPWQLRLVMETVDKIDYRKPVAAGFLCHSGLMQLKSPGWIGIVVP